MAGQRLWGRGSLTAKDTVFPAAVSCLFAEGTHTVCIPFDPANAATAAKVSSRALLTKTIQIPEGQSMRGFGYNWLGLQQTWSPAP